MKPDYLGFCIQMALYRPGQYVPSRLEYMVLGMGV